MFITLVKKPFFLYLPGIIHILLFKNFIPWDRPQVITESSATVDLQLITFGGCLQEFIFRTTAIKEYIF